MLADAQKLKENAPEASLVSSKRVFD